MSMIDDKLVFSSGQAITTEGDHPSTKSVPLGSGKNAFDVPMNRQFEGVPVRLIIAARVKAPFGSVGAATLQVSIQTSPDDATWTTKLSGPVIPVADLVAGKYALREPMPLGDMNKYMRLLYTVGTADFNAGTIDAQIAMDAETNK